MDTELSLSSKYYSKNLLKIVGAGETEERDLRCSDSGRMVCNYVIHNEYNTLYNEYKPRNIFIENILQTSVSPHYGRLVSVDVAPVGAMEGEGLTQAGSHPELVKEPGGPAD